MSHWHLTLRDEHESIITEQQIVLAIEDHQLLHIEGNPQDPTTWRFTQYGDDTQAKSEYICDIGKVALFCHLHSVLLTFLFI